VKVLVLLIAIVTLPVGGAVPDPYLSCMQDALDQCKDARFQLLPIQKDEFSKMFEVRRMKFTDWIKPVALYVQGATGLPASVLIAQAGLGSDWGGSPAFRNNNNIFKHMCWVPKSVISGEIEMHGRKFTYKGTCGTEKTFGQVSRPIQFPTREDSILAYLHVILFSANKYYKNLQEELKRGLKNNPIRQASFRSTASVLNSFSADTKYVSSLQTAIQSEKLSSYDVPGCWQCLVQQAAMAAQAAAPAAAAAPAPASAPAPAAPATVAAPAPAPAATVAAPAPIPAAAPAATGGK